MKYWVNVGAALVLSGLLWAPNAAFGQSKQELALKDVQREVFALEEKFDAFRTNQSERIAELETLLKQAMEGNKTLSSDIAGLKLALTQSLTDQQRTLADPVSKLKENIGDVSSDVTKLREDFAVMDKRSKDNDKKIDEILRAIRELPPPAPPPAPVVAPVQPPAAAVPSPDRTLFLAGLSDYALGRDKAMDEFSQILTDHPNSPDAPQATLLMGKLYDKAGQSDQAILAFNRVLEQFPTNDYQPDALFGKAEQLLKLGNRADALKEYKNFVTRYPDDPNIGAVQEAIKQLQSPAPAKPTAPKGVGQKGKRATK